jgi:hypothetical protein
VRSGATQAEVLERLRFIHFDYAEVSKMDQTMRQLIPFWTFTSRNLPMQMQMIYTQPAMYSAYQHVQRNTGAPNAPFTPDYWSRTGAWNTGLKAKGMPLYINPGLGFNQASTQLQELQDALKGDWGGLISELNPMMLAPAEFLGKKDLFRDRNFGPGDYSQAGGPLGKLIQAAASVVPGQTKQVGGQKLVSDNFMNLLTSIIPPLNQLQGLAPQSVGELGDADRQAEALARYIGIPIRTLSPKQQQQEKESKFYDVLDQRSTTKKLARRAAA